jgi:hypothetical protein
MAGRPARNLSVCCAVSQSEQAICEKSGRGSLTAIIIATLITAKRPSWLSKIMREHHEFEIGAATARMGIRYRPSFHSFGEVCASLFIGPAMLF